MLLIRRLWLLPASIFAGICYYLFLWPVDSIIPYPPGGAKNQNVHWVKHQERHPAAPYRQLPLGPLERIAPIQYDFASRTEPTNAKTTRENRRKAVKDSFVHAWNGYKKHAWGRDEVAPLSGAYRSSFGGWGATLVDTMDTLLLMGLEDDFALCVEAVKNIDFTTNEEDTLNVFETTIRYLGGLLAAYDLSGGKQTVLLDKARELGDILYSAFDTPNRMPQTRWNWKKTALGGEISPSTTALLAEIGSLTVEFTRLTQLTGDFRYFDAVQRITEVLASAQNTTELPGLWPTLVDAKEIVFDYNHFSMGGMADSTYEYLPKQYIMLGGRDQRYRHMYEKAMDAAKKHLFFRPLVPGSEDILFSGNAVVNSHNTTPIVVNTEPQGQHLACFVGGMVGIGAKIFSRQDDLDVARRLVDGCIWAYNAMPSGLMPELFYTIPCQVGTGSPSPGKCDWTEGKWYNALIKKYGAPRETEKMTTAERGRYLAEQRSLFPGFTVYGDNRYILRPEAIESVFIMYRITGDIRYQDIAWKMFQSIEKSTRTPIAHAAVHDVRKPTPEQSDRMESFWLAETLKYFYLIFSEPTLVSLDEWVLNTEAHPLRRPTT